MSGQATLSFGGDSVLLESAELDRLLRSLRQLPSPAAASMAEEVSARRLTGQIQLCPTEAELSDSVFDLCILDGQAMARHARWLERRKLIEPAVFLPALLIASRTYASAAARHEYVRRRGSVVFIGGWR